VYAAGWNDGITKPLTRSAVRIYDALSDARGHGGISPPLCDPDDPVGRDGAAPQYPERAPRHPQDPPILAGSAGFRGGVSAGVVVG
jgi:hypothetical protein